jgi:hypothetical protein
MHTPGWLARLRQVGIAALVAGLIGMVLAWQGGGAIGSGRLNAIGASPWQFGAALCVQLAVLGSLGLAGAALIRLVHRWWSDRRGGVASAGDDDEPGRLLSALQLVRSAVTPAEATDDEEEQEDEPTEPDEPQEVDPDEVTVKIPPGELAG